MLILKIPNLHITYKCIDTLLYGHICNTYYVEIYIKDCPEKVLKPNLLYLLTLKANQCKLNQKNLEYIVNHIINNLQEYSKNYNLTTILLKELNKDVFCYQLSSQYKSFRLCCYTNLE